jgi:hypothetical protein
VSQDSRSKGCSPDQARGETNCATCQKIIATAREATYGSDELLLALERLLERAKQRDAFTELVAKLEPLLEREAATASPPLRTDLEQLLSLARRALSEHLIETMAQIVETTAQLVAASREWSAGARDLLAQLEKHTQEPHDAPCSKVVVS